VRLLKIRLENFGIYAGTQELDLSPTSSDRPIVLVQGTNGAGKTTLLTAIRLALYGQRSLGLRVRRSDYEEYLRRRVNRHGGNRASVSVTFSYVRAGGQHTYEVTRSWQRANNIRERLILSEDGVPLQFLSGDTLDYFIRELIPPGLGELFFFDAEKIRLLATSHPEDPQLADSIKGLLGLDLPEQLQRDLAVLMAERPNSQENAEAQRELRDLQQQVDRIRAQLTKVWDDRDQLKAEMHEAEQRLSIAEQRLASQGGSYFEMRQELEHKLQLLTSQKEELERRIRDLVTGPLPFTLAGPLMQRLRDQLQAEQNTIDFVRMQKVWGPFIKVFKDSLARTVEDDLQRPIMNALDESWRQLLDSRPNVRVIHDLSDSDRQQLLARLDASELAAQDALNLFHQLKEVTTELGAIRSQLQRIPSDEVLSPLVKAFRSEALILQEYSLKLGKLEEQERALQQQLDQVERRQRQLEDRIRQRVRDNTRVALAERVQLALTDYRRRIQIKKVQAFKDAFIGVFNSLIRKKNFVAHADMDPNTFSLTLYGKSGEAIPQDTLSAGEQQLYAFAVLWALRSVSGRPLPLVIDSPLGRLDRKHRTHLLNKYFPFASHQVMILATDSEVATREAKALHPYTSAYYKLDHDASSGSTKIVPVEGISTRRRGEVAG